VRLTAADVEIIALAARHALPASYHVRASVVDGGLMIYTASDTDALSPRRPLCRPHSQGGEAGRPSGRTANTVRADLHLATAKVLRLEIPAKLLALADEVIE
jgi:putative ABC transport system substrate-binding protein